MKNNKLKKIVFFLVIPFLLVYGNNMYDLGKIIFSNPQKFSGEENLSFLQERFLFLRYKITKDEADLSVILRALNRKYRSKNYPQQLLYISNLGIINHKNSKEWPIYHSIANLSLGNQISNEEKNNIIEAINQKKIKFIPIEKSICQNKMYKGTEFLKPYEIEINDYFGRSRFECHFSGELK